MHVKKGDRVVVLSGREKGREGVIKQSLPKKERVVVENVNIVKKHVKPMGNRQGGILEVEAAMHVSKVMLICPACGKPSRTGHRVNDEGKKVRVCKQCNADVA
ncbi:MULTISPECIES: 50S ribosomal protein L24 [Herpetosiphon]|uniref:Large ribosomal subunit protein uL24 n=1 Tax=Herpetosiphon geysericola TaxID=70996 RepID=A0A0P6Y0V6_9CHLR|nr:50S ribosomal protein L24 [Herpetosiphon geysericola]KPL85539.1 50S ribosomal protein L24 [Herpetosiphon geysericola]